MIETLSLKNDETLGNIIYTLSANKYYYSVYLEIETSAASVDIHQDNFSKEIKYFTMYDLYIALIYNSKYFLFYNMQL